MENVSRKFSINAILYGSQSPSLETLHTYCQAERMDKQTRRRIGF